MIDDPDMKPLTDDHDTHDHTPDMPDSMEKADNTVKEKVTELGHDAEEGMQKIDNTIKENA